MGVFESSGSSELPTIITVFMKVFTTEYIFLMLGITIFILILYYYMFFKSGKWILKWYDAQKIEQSERPLLYIILENLSSKAGVKTPELFSFKSEIPAMFTVGSGSKSFITISTSMMKMFDESKLEGLLAHEIGHIKNKDVNLNTIAAFLAGLILLFPNFIMWCSMLSGFGQPKDPVPRLLRFLAAGIAAPPAAILVHLIKPAKREVEADKMAIKLTQNPQALAETIEFLENYIPLQPAVIKFNPGYFHLFSTHTQQTRGYLSIFVSMFDTHPETEERIERIMNYSTRSESSRLNTKHSIVPTFFELKTWKLSMVASFFSYLAPLLLIIVAITFITKDFNILVNGAITGVYLGVVCILMGIAAKLTYKKTNNKH